MMSHRHILGWVAVALIACVIGAAALGLGSHAVISDEKPRNVEARPELRLDERQVEEVKTEKYNELLHAGRGILNQAQVIVLVRVVKRDPATLSVLKSWKGPFPAGRVLHVYDTRMITGNLAGLIAQATTWQQALQAGEALIFTSAGVGLPDAPDVIVPGWAWASSDAQAQSLMQALDQAAKETQELQAPHPKASP